MQVYHKVCVAVLSSTANEKSWTAADRPRPPAIDNPLACAVQFLASPRVMEALLVAA